MSHTFHLLLFFFLYFGFSYCQYRCHIAIVTTHTLQKIARAQTKKDRAYGRRTYARLILALSLRMFSPLCLCVPFEHSILNEISLILQWRDFLRKSIERFVERIFAFRMTIKSRAYFSQTRIGWQIQIITNNRFVTNFRFFFLSWLLRRNTRSLIPLLQHFIMIFIYMRGQRKQDKMMTMYRIKL